MQILVIGSGAVGTVLATVLGETNNVSIASRQGAFKLSTAARIPKTSGPRKLLSVINYENAIERNWDVIISTDSLSSVGGFVNDLKTLNPQTVFCIVSQVPSELSKYRNVLGGGEVILLAPNFFAIRGERLGSLVNFWHPPLGAFVTLAGPKSQPVQKLFREAGFRANITSVTSVLSSAASTMPFMAELTIRNGHWPALVANSSRPLRAAREARHALGVSNRPFLPDWLIRFAVRNLPIFMPFDLPKYAREHFRRHSVQTKTMLAEWIQLSDRPTPALNSLYEAL